jgi:hypothetical protein
LRRPRESASFAFASASARPVPRAGIEAITMVNPVRDGHAIGPAARLVGFGFGAAGAGVTAVVVVVGAKGGAEGAATTGEIATSVRSPEALVVSRPETIPAVAEPAATTRSNREVNNQSPG